MGPGSGRPGVLTAPRQRSTRVAPPSTLLTWDRRLYVGLRVACVPDDIRDALASALGVTGVEAEHILALVASIVHAAPLTPKTGEAFLLGLEAACQRLRRVALALEIATQSYLAALESGYPSASLAQAQEDVWWPPFAGYTMSGEPLELRLRRCGYAYRHVVATHLASNIEAVAEHMALILHALATLPPAGVLPASALYTGLSELTSTLQGYVIPHHVTDLNAATPGLLTGITRLRALTLTDDSSLDGDIAWARAQLTFASQSHAGSAGPAVGEWVRSAVREWQSTITALEAMRR